MARAYIGIGTNLGDRAANIEAARAALAALPQTKLIAFSPVYETAPVGPVEQGAFLNAAAEIETQLDPHALLDALAKIEGYAGRTPRNQRIKWGPRTLDLDILLYDDQVIATGDLSVPHPMMHERWFVLKPLADLAPQAVHPLQKKTIAALLRDIDKKPNPAP